jgi:IS5 family transposase
MIGEEKLQGHLLEGWMELDTKTGKFLERLKRMLDWKGLHGRLEKLYSKGQGRPGYAPEVLFRMWLLERIYNVSDVRVVEEVNDRISFREFVGIPFGEEVPDDTTLVKFRQRIREAGSEEALWGWFEEQVSRQGLSLKKGSVVIVDATLVASHHRKESRDTKGNPLEPEAGTGKRGPLKVVHGYNMCIGYNPKTQLGGRPVVVAGNVSDTHLLPHVLTGKEGTVLADRGFDSYDNRFWLRGYKIRDGILHRRNRRPCLTLREEQDNRQWTRPRAAIESYIGCLKLWRGVRKMMVRGLQRVKQFLEMAVMAENIVRMVKRRRVVSAESE